VQDVSTSAVEASGSADKVFIARQPIFDAEQRVFGYELLYRNSSFKNSYDSTDGTAATLAVIRDAVLILGTQLTGRNKAFINFNPELLKKKVAFTMRPETTVIEIGGSVVADSAALQLCRELRREGYTIALDDFDTISKRAPALIDVADIIKVDFRQASAEQRANISRSYNRSKLKLLAEKVETMEEFFEARRLGYLYFQGYFFGEPQMVSANTVPGNKMNGLRVLGEINQPNMDFAKLDEIIKRDVYLTFTLLNFINSAYFGLRDGVSSIMQALALLGEREIRKWACLVLMTFIGADRPSEVSMTSLVRGKLCELLANKAGLSPKKPELFIIGMLSMLDVLVGRPLNELLDKINISEDIKAALTTGRGRMGQVLQLVIAYEKALWEEVDSWASKLGFDSAEISTDYQEAIQWAEQVFDPAKAKAPATD
jgi:EAL and modified HD-GYP domain-containing signal transduction protein